jgi:hypothetical protein
MELLGIVLLIVVVLAAKYGVHRLNQDDSWFQRRVGGWWERTFPPRERKQARGFEVKMKQNAGETPVPGSKSPTREEEGLGGHG